MLTRNIAMGRALRVALMASCAGLGAAAWTAPAFAQDEDAASEEAAGPAIVITGSRIQRRDYTATSPIVTVDADVIEKSSSVNLEANLNKLPQFAPALTQFPTDPNLNNRGDIQASANNTLGAATVSLRQLGSNRNLVLIDGRRPTPVNGTGVVDINSIPSAAVERVEIITGGASSTYGADAVGGVVNFILKKNFKGVALDGQMGLTQGGDGREFRVSSLVGAALGDGRGSVMMGLEYYDRAKILQGNNKAYQKLYAMPTTATNTIFSFEQDYISWGTQPVLPTAATVNAFPSQNAYNTLYRAKGAPATAGGVAVNIPVGSSVYINTPSGTGEPSTFINTAVTPTGGPYTPLVYGYTGTIDGITRKLTNTGVLRDNYIDQNLSTPQTRYSFFAKGSYDLTDDITFFSQANFVKTRTTTNNLVPPAIGTWGTEIPHGSAIYTGNPALGIASSLLANGNTNPEYTAGGRYGLSCPTTGGCTNSQVFPVPTELAYLLDRRTVARSPATETDAAYATRLAAQGCSTLPSGVAPGAEGSGANCAFAINKFLKQVGERYTDNQNVTFQLLVGFEGKIPGTDWTWDVSASHGETVAKTDQYNFASVEATRAILAAPNYGVNFKYKGNSEAPGGGNNNGFQGATGICTSGVNPFKTTVWSEDCKNAMRIALQNENRVYQDYFEANLQGGLIELPYGQLRFALGADYRRNGLRFHADAMATEGSSFLTPVNGVYPQGNTAGDINVKEIYGELLIPLLADLPFAQALNIEAGYRLSDYNTIGTVGTWKVNGEWAPARWLRFRGGYQQASRAPNLGELFTSRSATLSANNADGDPCSRANSTNPNIGNYSANPIGLDSELQPIANDTNGGNADAAKVEALCRALMGPEGSAQYYIANRATYSTVGGFAFPTLIGNPGLKEETATTYTIGGVITSPLDSPWLRRLNMAVDYYHVELTNAIAQGGVDAIFRQCFSKLYNPNYDPTAGTCPLVERNRSNGEVGTTFTTYNNGGYVLTDGIDLSLNWGLNFKDAGIGLPGTYSVSVQGTYLFHFKTSTDFTIVNGKPLIPTRDWVGSLGPTFGEVGTNPGAYRWKLFTTFSYNVGPVTASLQWQHKPKANSVQRQTALENIKNGGTATVPNITGAPAYDLFGLSGTVTVTRDTVIRFGIDNLFDKQPPLINVNLDATGGIQPGGSYDAGQYDVLGRRFYIGANIKF